MTDRETLTELATQQDLRAIARRAFDECMQHRCPTVGFPMSDDCMRYVDSVLSDDERYEVRKIIEGYVNCIVNDRR